MTRQPDPADITIKLAQDLVRVGSVTPLNAADLPTASSALDVAAAAAQKTGATATRLELDGGHT